MFEAVPMTLRQQFLWNAFRIWTAPGEKPHRCPGCRKSYIIDKNPRRLCGDCTGGQ